MKRNKNLIIGLVILLVIVLFGGYQMRARTHFRHNVTINGINVGGMTVSQAQSKVNANQEGKLVFQNGKVVRDKKLGSEQKLSTADIQKMFNDQRRMLPGRAQHFQKYYQGTQNSKTHLQALVGRKVSYNLNGSTYTFKANDLLNGTTYEDGAYHVNPAAITSQLNKINSEKSTMGKTYHVTTPEGVKSVKAKTYGWDIDVSKASNAIANALTTNKQSVNGGNYLKGNAFNIYGTGYGVKANGGIGKNYVAVSLAKQHLWVYKNNKVVTSIDIVSGTNNGNDNTPTGVFYIGYKQSPSVLRGKNSNGSDYASKVSRWMPFTEDGCGIHDASWRDDWSSSAWQSNGSHGCLNVRPSQIDEVWNNVDKDEPVVIF